MTKAKRLLNIINHAYKNAPAFNALMKQAGLSPDDIKTQADLCKIPITSKEELLKQQQQQPPFGGWLAVPPHTLRRIFISPGPIFEPQGNVEVIWETGVEAFQALGIGAGDIVLNTFMYHLVPAGLALDNALRAVGATSVPSGPGNSGYQAEIILKLGVNGFIGTPSFLKIILDKIEAMHIPKQDIPLKKAFLTAEPYPQSLKSYFEDTYGLATFEAYGTADLGIIAYQETGQPGLKTSKNLIIEIVDLESGQPASPGEVGQVVVTTFDKTYPLIRLGTGDLSAFTDQKQTHVKGWLGRSGDAIKVRGMFLHPLQITQALDKMPGVANVQAIIQRFDVRDNITLKVEFVSQGDDEAMVIDQIKTRVGASCRLKIDAVELIPHHSIPGGSRVIIDKRTWD